MQAITDKRILKIAFPIVISNATVPILGAVDTGVIGQMGEVAPVGAVGIGAVIIGSLFWFFGFLRMGTSGMAAQAIGAGDDDEGAAVLFRALWIGIAAGIVLILLQGFLFWGAFQLAPASPKVERLADEYLRIRIYSAPAVIAIYGFSGWLIACERTRSLLFLQLWMNGINITLDLFFVMQLGWGVEGVATASLIAEYSGFFMAIFLCKQAFQTGVWQQYARIFNINLLKKMAIINGNIMLRTFMLQIAFTSFLFMASSFDDVTLAANQILLQFLFISSYALDGFALAAETLVGQAVGDKNAMRLRQTVRLCFKWGWIGAGVMSIMFLFGGHALIALLTTSTAIREVATQYLPWMIISPIIGVASWMFDGIFIGATRTKELRNAMFQSFLIYGITLFIGIQYFGNHGLWFALMMFFIARGLTLWRYYPSLYIWQT